MILQGNAVTQTVLGGLTIYLLVANFLQCICAKNYGNWLAVDKVIAKIIRLTFLAHPVHGSKFLDLTRPNPISNRPYPNRPKPKAVLQSALIISNVLYCSVKNQRQ